MDRLKSMEIFVEVVRRKSLTAAAAQMELSSQMIGQHIRNLEKNVGAKLLNRTTRQLGLTEAGHVFFDHCTQIIDLVEASHLSLQRMKAEPQGLLRITAPSTFGSRVMAPSLAKFGRLFPQVNIDLFLTDAIMDLIADEVEIAVRIGDLPDSSLIARSLGPYRMVIAAAPDYLRERGTPTSPSQLSSHDCVGFRLKLSGRQWRFLREDGDLHVPVYDKLSINSGEALRQAALAGAGIVLQPEVLLRDDLAAGRLVQLLPDERLPERPIHLIYRPDRFATPKQKAIIEFGLAHWKVAK
ncbi:LysR substrate-binding domain-containing protein [Neorhizobium sp. JUb45]|uniref:LysR substrate-binding domain-containing protein n=1 Tax=unclassified Neorhizobium TaxID=2629175 RepID=UPI001051FB9B|nr:LysR substrate-binding domain-containing protein [Neorhizobium sp. JUb45]TCR03020.1 DNA-binding transcriptional LysR family regulator [Neorhizobium sp. JUb45]